MDATEARPEWWQRLAERAALPPVAPRVPLGLDGGAGTIGSIEPPLATRLQAAGLPLRSRADGGFDVQGAPDAALDAIARWLQAHGLTSRWRDEALAVTDAEGRRRAVIERAAVRPLGIATHAVHLIGLATNGGVWVQQRALDKATDPGQWDTLMGGLVAADETDADALARETWEEAGLRLADLRDLRPVDRFTVRRPVTEGYLVEHVAVFEALVPDGLQPLNQDGEVAGFACLSPAGLGERLAAGAFTLEAALMLAASLRRRGLL